MPVLNIEEDNTSFVSGLETNVMAFLNVFAGLPSNLTLANATEFEFTSGGLIYRVTGVGLNAANSSLTSGMITGVTVLASVQVEDEEGRLPGDPDYVPTTEEEDVYTITGLALDAASTTKAADMRNLAWTINGTSGAEIGTSTLSSTVTTVWNLGSGNDSVVGGAGIDRMNGSIGNDTLNGGAGNDTINGGSGTDYLYGGADNDYILAGSSSETNANRAEGGDGNDRVSGTAGDEILQGNNGNDSVFGNGGDDILTGGTRNVPTTGAITYTENVSTTVLGRDYLSGGAGNDLIYGVEGNDVLLGGTGVDRLYGGNGDDRLSGQDGDDRLYGDRGVDNLSGGDGDDYMSGGADRDIFAGGAGNDTMIGGSGNDTFSDTAGNDSMNGGTGNDILRGGAGNDRLNGGSNSDKLYGGAGADTLTGGSGSDQFIFSTRADLGGDVITDYNAGNGDVIRLSALNLDLDTGTTFEKLSDGSSQAEVIWSKGTTGGSLLIDTDNNGTANYEIEVRSTQVLDLSDLNLIV